MIPSIANYLNISADQLFGINLEERKINIKKILDLDDDYAEKFDLKSSLDLLENSLKNYPNDEYLLQRLTRNYHNLICLMKEDNQDKKQELRKKIIENSLKVLEIAKDDEIRMRAKTFLCWYYPYFGEMGIQKAKEIADKTVSVFNAKEVLFTQITKSDEKKQYVQELLKDCLELLIREITNNVVDYLENDKDKILMYKKSIEIIKIIIGDNNLYDYNRQCNNYVFNIAKLYAKIEDKENTINFLYESVTYANSYLKLQNEGVYDSFLLRNKSWEKIVTKPLYMNINVFNDKLFDFIKDTNEVKKIKKNVW